MSPALFSLLLGAVAATGFAPLQFWPLTILAFAGWLWLVHDAPRMRSALWRGWLFGVGHFSVNNNWIQHAFTFQDAMPHWLGYLAPLALALYLAVYPMLAAGLVWRLASPRSVGDAISPPGVGFALVAGAVWIVSEWLRATMFTGYAWDPVGVIWVAVPGVARMAALVGTYALSGLSVAASGAVLAAMARRDWRPAAAVAVLVGGRVAAGAVTPVPPTDPAAPLVRVVQPDVGQDARGLSDAEPMLRRLLALSGRPGARRRLVLWPEGVVRDYLDDGYPFYIYDDRYPERTRARMAAVLGPDDRLLAGTTPLRFDNRDDVAGASNAIQAVAPDGSLVGRYDKAHLVPYGEYLPMRWLLEPLGLSRLVPGDFDFDAGPGPRAIPLPGFGEIGVQLCYEIIFSGEVVDPAHRPRMIFNPSNDAWFGAWGPPQHLAQARMRAIEEGLPVIRATPNGISAVIAADGRVLARVPHGVAGAIELPMPAALPPTPFARIGNWAAVLVAGGLLVAAFAIRRRAR